ncbi:MAG: DNA-3-methyladenine glycosylase family protein [Gammaproteobacteria bacterium]
MPGRLDRASLAEGVAHILAQEPGLQPQVERFGLPALWERDPGFETLIRIVLEQQVATAAAEALQRRLHAAIGTISPEAILALGDAALRALGVTRQKAGYCIGIAERVLDGRLDFEALHRAEDDAARGMLLALRGIGPWTADVYLLMALGRPDVFPAGDLAVQIALGKLRGMPQRPSAEESRALTQGWAPYRAVGARLLWQAYVHRKELAP